MGKRVGIRGAGLAGLSLARELIKTSADFEICLFDTRSELPHPQRTFCFFSKSDSSQEEFADFCWRKIRFKSDTRERTLDLGTRRYTLVSGESFFESHLRVLSAARVQFQWNCTRVDISDNAISTDKGNYPFDIVIDAAFDRRTARSLMWQSFGGLRVKVKGEIFDPTTAVLMDLRESTQRSPLNFFYILPTSNNEALIEHTSFSPHIFDESFHFDRVKAWIDDSSAGSVEVVGREYGVIPMGLEDERCGESITIGSRSGAIRSSTGYGFLNIQRQAKELSAAIHEDRRLEVKPSISPTWSAWCDNLFLRALLANPTEGRDLMNSILFRSSAEALPAFLNGDAGLLEALRVMSCASKLPMVKALLHL
jgi:lycopene beta-cyclase